MKRIISLLFAIGMLTGNASAQDIIVKQNADELQARIIEIGETQIKYRKFSNPDGPLYTIAKSEVFLIKYENGEKEVINAQNGKPATDAATTTQPQNNGVYTRLEHALKLQKQPHHKKHWQVEAQAKGSLAVLLFEDDSWTGGGATIGGNFNYFPQLDSRSMIGAGISYAYYSLSTIDIEDVDLQMLNLEFYYGISSERKHLGAKSGFHLGVPLSCKMGDYDMGESTNGVIFGPMVQLTWSPKHFDLGGQIVYDVTNVFKEINSSLFTISLVFSYKF